MRSYLRITCHVVVEEEDDDKIELKSLLLSCNRFSGRHTGQRIASTFESELQSAGIKDKIEYLVTDNAANMRSAFSTIFPVERSEQLDPESVVQDENLDDFLNLNSEIEADFHESLDGCATAKTRLSCFAHSLQLVVRDGLTEAMVLSKAVAKASRLSSLLHRSTVFKERFEAKFGNKRSIPSVVVTRWNSTLRQLQSIIKLGLHSLNEVCQDDFSEVSFSGREWNMMIDVCDILKPFAEATDLTQGDKSVTISFVVPTVLDLYSHLDRCQGTSCHCRSLINALKKSLQTRFLGIFEKCKMLGPFGGEMVPFSENVYFMAAVLDPVFACHWIDVDVVCDDEEQTNRARSSTRRMLEELVVKEAEKAIGTCDVAMDPSTGAASSSMSIHCSSSEEDSSASPDNIAPHNPSHAKLPRLLLKYNRISNKNSVLDSPNTARKQYTTYIEQSRHGQLKHDNNPLRFWRKHSPEFPALAALAKQILSIPASSAPVERVFSQGGIIIRPHRSSMTCNTLSMLTFLKCNENLL